MSGAKVSALGVCTTPLIAAAPELLAALKKVQCRGCGFDYGELEYEGSEVDGCSYCGIARAAIAKAEGRA